MTASTITRIVGKLPLRDYQTQAIKAINTRWDAGIWRPTVVLPTGGGKTVVFSHLADQYLAANPGKRVLVLSHTDELVLQAAAKMRDVAPHRTVGIVKAERNEVHAEIISASVQSLRSESRRNQLRHVGLMIIDECHHAVAKTFRTILEHYGAIPPTAAAADWRPACQVAGFTATLMRADKEKLSDVWQDVAFRLSIAFMIRSGYLLDVRGKRVEVPDLDLRTVRTSGGDYAEGALGEALVEAMAPEIVAKAYAEHATDRKGIVFAPTVASAYAFADAFNAAGVGTEVVHGALARDERRAILARLHTGATQVVANCMVLTEGFDEPTVSCAVIARPTKSAGLYQQMVGRVLRPDLTLPVADRGHALVLDVVGVSRQHDLRSLIDLSTRDDLTEKDLDEDLSLLELEDLIEEEAQDEPTGTAPETGWYVGPAETREFDPLGRDSTRTWGRTPAGSYWLAAGTAGYVLLADSMTGEPGTYDVVWCTKDAPTDGTSGAATTEHRGLDLEMALAWAEEEATARGGFGAKTLTSKTARWRKDPATSGLAWKVRRAGVRVDQVGDEYFLADGEPLTKGRASEIIDSAAAAARIDPLVIAARATLAAYLAAQNTTGEK